MDHLEVIKLSRKIDGNGSIVLSMRYTPLIDVYLETSTCYHYNNDNECEDFNEVLITHVGATVPEHKQYLYDGNQVVVASAKWLSFRTLSIVKKQGCYFLGLGMFGFSLRLIESFLKGLFKTYFGKPDVGPRLLWSQQFNTDICLEQTNTSQTQHTSQSATPIWRPKHLLAQLSNQGNMARVAHSIIQNFMTNKKYSVMVFNASESEKDLLPFYVQYILFSVYEKAAHLWLNIDLTRGNFNITDEVLSEVSMNLPSIASYSNILEAYRDATAASISSTVSSNCQGFNSLANYQGFGRYSSNKHTLNGVFDKMGDTEGAISIVFCDCHNIDALTSLQDILNTNDVQIQSFYRKGRIDGELTFMDKEKEGRNLNHSKKKERTIQFIDKITGSDEKYGPI